MQLVDFWAALRRRWYLVIVALMLGVGAAVGAVYLIGPTYKAEAAILILPPGTSTQTDGGSDGNPYLSLGGVSQARDVVIRAVMSSTTRAELCETEGDAAYNTMRASLCADDPSVSYLAAPDFTSSAPMIIITSEADDPVNSIVAVGAVADRVPVALHDLQVGLKLRDRALIKSMPVVMDSVPEATHKKQIRGGIVAGAGALAFGLLLIGFIDGFVLARRPRRALVAGNDEGESDEPISDRDGPEQLGAPEPDSDHHSETEHAEPVADSESEAAVSTPVEGGTSAPNSDGDEPTANTESVDVSATAGSSR